MNWTRNANSFSTISRQQNDTIKRAVEKDLYIIQTTLRNDFFKKGLEKELEQPGQLIHSHLISTKT